MKKYSGLRVTRSRHLTIVGLTLFFCALSGCKDFTGLETAYDQMRSDRELAEALVRDVKKRIAPNTSQYAQVEQLYAEARAKQEGFLLAFKNVVSAGESSASIKQVAQDANQGASTFVATASGLVNPDLAARGVLVEELIQLPIAIIDFIKQLSAARRNLILQKVDADLHWRPWSEI